LSGFRRVIMRGEYCWYEDDEEEKGKKGSGE
jgi:hypothetical protein